VGPRHQRKKSRSTALRISRPAAHGPQRNQAGRRGLRAGAGTVPAAPAAVAADPPDPAV